MSVSQEVEPKKVSNINFLTESLGKSTYIDPKDKSAEINPNGNPSAVEWITGRLARPNQQDPSGVGGVDAPWYLKYGSRVLGIVAAFFAILFGLWNVVSILTLNVGCLVAGIIQMVAGFVVMGLEAPCCFPCIEQVDQMAVKVDSKPLFFRAGLYCALAVPPIFMCFGLASLFGSGLIFATGAVYGMMALGKKASREDMAAAATSPTQMGGGQPGGQMQMGGDQHITLMEDPDVWRPT